MTLPNAISTQRALARNAAAEKAKAVNKRVSDAIKKARQVLADDGFMEVLRSQGVETLPRLRTDSGSTHHIDNDAKLGKDQLNEVSLEFVIVWSFLFPLFAKPEVAIHLEKTWPGFILDLKDAFIALVVEGPFPHAVSGHRGRRRDGRDFRKGKRKGARRG